MPQLLLLYTLGVGAKVSHQVFYFLDFSLSVSVHDLSHVLHKSEVSSHGVSESSQLA